MQHSVANAVSLATIAGILDQAQERIALSILADEIGGGIVRPVIHDDNFCVPMLSSDVVRNPFEARAQALGFVICGYDDAVFGHQESDVQRKNAAEKVSRREPAMSATHVGQECPTYTK